MSKDKAVTKINAGALGAMVEALPKVPAFNATKVAQDIANLNEQADKVLAAAKRADLQTEATATTATTFLATITKRIKEVDDERKGITGNFDKLVKGLNGLFTKGPLFKLDQAKTILQAKLGAYARAERIRLEEEADAERKRIAAEAAKQAQKAIKDGDRAGAVEILQNAAAVDVQPEALVIRSATASLSSVKRNVGSVTDLRKFLAWVAANNDPAALAALGGISVGQRELNQLAVAVLVGGHAPVPGFDATEEETFGAR